MNFIRREIEPICDSEHTFFSTFTPFATQIKLCYWHFLVHCLSHFGYQRFKYQDPAGFYNPNYSRQDQE